MMYSDATSFIDEIYSTSNAAWEQLALSIFRYQRKNNALYKKYCDLLAITDNDVNTILQIPFLPIQFFKSNNITTGDFEPQLVFESSATTGSSVSRHLVKNSVIYEQSFLKGFKTFYGNAGSYCILGLLPSYLERGQSSLVYMVNQLIQLSGNSSSGFYLQNFDELHQTILRNEQNAVPTLLIGVTYALLDFAEKYPVKLEYTNIMETGGMKGRREELTRLQVHEKLTTGLGVNNIHSEYGMTELLSQAYSKGYGLFECTKTMRVLIRSEDDPFDVKTSATGKDFITGAINIIDLSNVDSCSFIATDDIGKLYPNGQFEVLGRMDNSDIRGCSLMAL